MKRRRFLAAGAGSLVGLPTVAASGETVVGRGVAANGEAVSSGESPAGPAAAVRAYYRRAQSLSAGESTAFTADVRELSYSSSPLPEIVEADPGFLSKARRRSVAETTVVAENVDPSRFTADSRFLRSSLSDADLRAIGNRNAVVTVTFESAPFQQEWLVAVEDGAWRLVYFRTMPANSPTGTVRAYYGRAQSLSAGESGAFTADVRELSYSSSPLPELASADPGLFSTARRASVVETRLLAEDIDPERVTDDSNYLRASLSDADLRAVADRNAVVAVTLEIDGSRVVQQWFLAVETDEWRLVWVADVTTPREVVRELYQLADSADTQAAFADSVQPITHEASQLAEVFDQPLVGESLYTGLREATVTDTAVVDRGLDAGQITGEYFGVANRSATELRSLLGETAVVETTVQFDEGTGTQRWLVGTQDGEWRLVGL